MDYDIFFSYSHLDRGVATEFVAKLEAAGLRCFLADKDIAAGDLWEPRVRDALKVARRVLLLITPRSKDSLWVAAEAGAAWALEKKLVACLMFVEADQLIEPIGRRQARRVETQEETESLVSEITESLKRKTVDAT